MVRCNDNDIAFREEVTKHLGKSIPYRLHTTEKGLTECVCFPLVDRCTVREMTQEMKKISKLKVIDLPS